MSISRKFHQINSNRRARIFNWMTFSGSTSIPCIFTRQICIGKPISVSLVHLPHFHLHIFGIICQYLMTMICSSIALRCLQNSAINFKRSPVVLMPVFRFPTFGNAPWWRLLQRNADPKKCDSISKWNENETTPSTIFVHVNIDVVLGVATGVSSGTPTQRRSIMITCELLSNDRISWLFNWSFKILLVRL